MVRNSVCMFTLSACQLASRLCQPLVPDVCCLIVCVLCYLRACWCVLIVIHCSCHPMLQHRSLSVKSVLMWQGGSCAHVRYKMGGAGVFMTCSHVKNLLRVCVRRRHRRCTWLRTCQKQIWLLPCRAPASTHHRSVDHSIYEQWHAMMYVPYYLSGKSKPSKCFSEPATNIQAYQGSPTLLHTFPLYQKLHGYRPKRVYQSPSSIVAVP